MTVDYKLLGKNIKKARNKQGMSQFGLSDLTDISPQYLSQIETGKKKASLLSLVKISTALNITIDELLHDCYDSDTKHFLSEISSLLQNTTTYERMILLESTKSLKYILQQNCSNFNK